MKEPPISRVKQSWWTAQTTKSSKLAPGDPRVKRLWKLIEKVNRQMRDRLYNAPMKKD